MKRIVSLLIIATMSVLTVFSASANSISIKSVNVTESKVTINYNTEGLETGEQVTVITYQADSADAEPTEDNIKYINQIDKSYSTALDFSFNEVPSGTYQIKMGGTEVEAPDSIAITIIENASGAVNYHNNKISFFANAPTAPELINGPDGKKVILKPVNYFATFASIPSMDGYTVKACGIIYNGDSFSATVDLQTQEQFGIIFQGAKVTTELKVTAYPYVTYEKQGAEEITYYGSTIVNTLSFE